jgi:hypothetical protein
MLSVLIRCQARVAAGVKIAIRALGVRTVLGKCLRTRMVLGMGVVEGIADILV